LLGSVGPDEDLREARERPQRVASFVDDLLHWRRALGDEVREIDRAALGEIEELRMLGAVERDGLLGARGIRERIEMTLDRIHVGDGGAEHRLQIGHTNYGEPPRRRTQAGRQSRWPWIPTRRVVSMRSETRSEKSRLDA